MNQGLGVYTVLNLILFSHYIPGMLFGGMESGHVLLFINMLLVKNLPDGLLLILILIFTFLMTGFEFCVFVAGWRHVFRSEWPMAFYY